VITAIKLIRYRFSLGFIDTSTNRVNRNFFHLVGPSTLRALKGFRSETAQVWRDAPPSPYRQEKNTATLSTFYPTLSSLKKTTDSLPFKWPRKTRAQAILTRSHHENCSIYLNKNNNLTGWKSHEAFRGSHLCIIVSPPPADYSIVFCWFYIFTPLKDVCDVFDAGQAR